jgi:hypothetical protein
MRLRTLGAWEQLVFFSLQLGLHGLELLLQKGNAMLLQDTPGALVCEQFLRMK